MASKSNGKQASSKAKMGNLSFQGWRRENGRVGVRNHVVILPLDDLSNAACEAVANNIKGTLALPHAYGRLQFGADLDLFFRTLIGTGSNPNVAAVVVIGIEDGWTKRVVDGIAKTGKPVAGFGIELHGDIATIAKASHKAKEFLQWASELQREECPIQDLWVSTKCGESDTTTGLPVLAMPLTTRSVQLSSMPMTTTAATLGFDPVPMSVRKNRSRSAPNCSRP